MNTHGQPARQGPWGRITYCGVPREGAQISVDLLLREGNRTMCSIERSVEEVPGAGDMTRREALRIMAVAGLFASPLAALAGEPPSLVEAGEIQTKDGKRGYSIVTQTEYGTTIRAIATPNRLVFDVRGVKLDHYTPLVALPNDAKELTAQQKRAKEAAAKLLAASGSFVAPRNVKVTDGSIKGKVRVSFLFLGEEDPDRRIRVTLKLRTALGRVIEPKTRECGDQRIAAKAGPVMVSRIKRYASSVNSAGFIFKKSLVTWIRSLEVIFDQC